MILAEWINELILTKMAITLNIFTWIISFGSHMSPKIYVLLLPFWASLVAQLVKNPPAMLETWVQSLGSEDPLEKAMATHPSILAGRIHGLYSPSDHKGSDTTEWLSLNSHSTDKKSEFSSYLPILHSFLKWNQTKPTPKPNS